MGKSIKKIKLVDRTFAHSKLGYCTDYQTSDLFEWDRSLSSNDFNTIVYTDMVLNQAKDNSCAWLIEPIGIAPQNYDLIKQISHKFNKVFTHEETLLELGEPFTLVPFGCCWIKPEDQKIYDKSKMVSIIASNKRMTVGHILRHDIIGSLNSYMDVYGRGWNPIDYKLEGLKDYMFSIVIENCKRDYWFTEKLIDCLMTGTVPIYYGCPSIGNFFDTRGFIMIDGVGDAKRVIMDLTEEKYNDMLPYIKDNFEKAKEYLIPDNIIFKILNSDER
jgi:hypothetical protein